MGLSATRLGEKYGLTGQEMNVALKKLGYLDGDPGAYFPTEKGLPFMSEEYHHRGPGGYARYNANWETRTIDPAIRKELKITPELKDAVRAEVKAARAAKIQARKLAEAEADAAFRAKLAAEQAAKKAAAEAAEKAARNAAKLRKAGKIGLIVICVAGVAYGLYKLTPVVKRKIKEREEKKAAQKKD